MNNKENIYKSEAELLAELLTEARETKIEIKEIKNRLPGREQEIIKEIGLIDNSELIRSMNISAKTASRWRKNGVLRFTKIQGKFYYLLADIKDMLRERFSRT